MGIETSLLRRAIFRHLVAALRSMRNIMNTRAARCRQALLASLTPHARQERSQSELLPPHAQAALYLENAQEPPPAARCWAARCWATVPAQTARLLYPRRQRLRLHAAGLLYPHRQRLLQDSERRDPSGELSARAVDEAQREHVVHQQ